MPTKIIVLGDSGSGKTSLIHKFCFPLDNPKVNKTIGIDCTSRIIKFNQMIYQIQFWDVAGGSEWIKLYPKYVNNSHIALIVYDVTNKNSFLNIKKWINMVRQSNGYKFPIVVIGNKVDKESARVIDKSTYKIYTEQFTGNIFLLETSTNDNTGCKEALHCILSQLKPVKKTLTTMTVQKKPWYDIFF